MNKTQAEDYIYQSYLKSQKYQSREAKDATKRTPGLSRDIIRAMCTTPCVVVTGSKGKGSVACMISQILQTQLSVGLMTSPHLADFCERMRINGTMISDADFAKHVEKIKLMFDKVDLLIPPDKCISPMGIQTALALSYFNEGRTQFNVFECGKGAKYDDVNNVLHQYAVINSIFLEHTRELGGSVEEIARDKCHVITGEQKCVYVAQQKQEVMAIISQRANSLNVAMKIYGKDFWSDNIRYTHSGMLFDVTIGEDTYKDIAVPLLGEHQARNCALAMALCKDVLGTLAVERLKANLAAMSWPGRMEIVSTAPFVLLDACINSASTENVKQTLHFLNIEKYTVVVGIPDDKDYGGVVKAMQEKAAYTILTRSQNPHYVFTEMQKKRLAAEGIDAVWTKSIPEAVALAQSYGLPTVILGTTSVVSEVKALF
ncbi:MAG: bifunctional folylpolyglutamate synthase/dihydrofolate synthase [Muribaculaceae bacterium]